MKVIATKLNLEEEFKGLLLEKLTKLNKDFVEDCKIYPNPKLKSRIYICTK